jgi:hypothetical protein
MTTTLAAGDIHAFAVAVRAQLDDLPADDVDDLLDGLEADLSDQAAEAGEDFALPDAAAYAAELRAAAGLPERGVAPSGIRSLRSRLDDLDARAAAWLRSNPALTGLAAFFVALRPAWWVLRGTIAFALVAMTTGLGGQHSTAEVRLLDTLTYPAANPLALLLLGGLVVVSVQWGRGRWLPARWMRSLPVALTVVTAVALPIVGANAVASVRHALLYAESAEATPYPPGLALDGQRVRNIFAYDADGQPLTHVQLFDQNGQPLTTVGSSGQRDEVDYYFSGGGGPAPVAEREIGRQPVWNVFPLRELPADVWATGDGEPDTADATAPRFPFSAVPSAMGGEPEPSPTPAAENPAAENPVVGG